VSEPIYDRNGNISNPDTDERKKNSSKSDGSKESDPPVTVTVNSQILGSNYGRRSQSPKKKEHEHKDDKKKKDEEKGREKTSEKKTEKVSEKKADKSPRGR